ncbi:MAG: DUF1800 domain-containing protein [Bacteroidia bacterium]|nr:DUF1800 domain-containing protein [Bacteroidia bacterium]
MKNIYLTITLILACYHTQAQLYGDYLGNGHNSGISITSSHESSTTNKANNTLDGFASSEKEVREDVSRFLAQATFGADFAEIERVTEMGFEAWMQEQFELEPNFMLPISREIYDFLVEENEIEEGEVLDAYINRLSWWELVLNAQDQLRQRVAFALSEILVTSAITDELLDAGDGMADYYDLLIRHSFGNYRDLLMDVSLHPVMGIYLSHFNNPKADTVNNVFPDENYAREIMQLFSMGLYELNMNGSRKTDSNGEFIPTYSNKDIKEFAKVFTGLGPGAVRTEIDEDLPEDPFFGLSFFVSDAIVPMKMYDYFHEPGPKYLLNGQVVPAGQTGMQDIEDAIDNVFNHPSTPPFISRLLIQRLVTSNPRPEYIERVANVFVNNGKGVRGDLKAVVRAILTDNDARECGDRTENIHKAMLREPIVRYAHFMRATEVSNPDENLPAYINISSRFYYITGQMAQLSPSVFNFFLPDYQPNGIISDLGLVAPEFQIHNSNTSVGYLNEVDFWTFRQSMMPYYDPRELAEEGEDLPLEFDPELGFPAFIDLESFLEVASQGDEALMNRVDLLFTHGELSSPARSIILNAIQQIQDPESKVYMALYLIMISPDYVILN